MRKFVWALIGLGAVLLLVQGVTGFLGDNRSSLNTYRESFLGPIYDAENRLLAESVKTERLLLLPQAFKPDEKNLDLLAQITGQDQSTLTLLLSREKGPIILPKLDSELSSYLEGLPGIIQREYYERHYPFGKLWPILEGSAESYSGLEAYYRSLLIQPQTSLNLGIKIEVQQALERDVKRILQKLKAQAGGAVVLDISSGRVKALATVGEKDLLLKDQLPLSTIQEPIEEAYYESIYTNWEDFLRALGFGELTKIDLPGETVGVLPVEVEDLGEVWASPIQMVRALAALVSGKLFTPKIAMEIHTGDDTYVLPTIQKELEDLIPRETGGVWSWGGTKQEGIFLVAGLWPSRKPVLAYLVYLKGVEATRLPYQYASFVPSAVKSSRWPKAKPREKKVVTTQKAQAQAPRVMPDVRGLTLKDVMARLVPLGLKVKFSGFGVAVEQWPAPGTPLNKYKECRVVLK